MIQPKQVVTIRVMWFGRSEPLRQDHGLLGVDVDVGRLPRGVLDDQEQLGDDLDDVTRLEDQVALAVLAAGVAAAHETAWQVGLLCRHLPGRGVLRHDTGPVTAHSAYRISCLTLRVYKLFEKAY